MGYRVDEIEGIGKSHATKLAVEGITSTDQLLKLCCTRRGRKGIAASTGLSEKRLLEWANMADLMRINGVGRQFAELLERSGVDTVKELRNRNPENLAARMDQVNRRRRLTRRSPSASMVAGWVAEARRLDPVIRH